MITTLINPPSYSSGQDALWHIATSDNSGQTDFKYVFDIFKDGEQLIRVKLFPEDNGKGYFDAGNVIKNEFTYEWFTPDNAGQMFLNDIDNKITYNIRVGEDFSGITTLNMASGDTEVYNFTPPLFKRRQIDISSKQYKWLTNRPLKLKAGYNDKILIPYYLNSGSNISMQYILYQGNTIYDQDSGIYIGNSTKEFSQIDIGVQAINETAGFIIDDSITSYRLRFYNVNDGEYSEWITVNIVCEPRYTPINLYFINQWGMFDTARFGLASRLTMNTERKTFQKREYSFGSSSVDYQTNGIYNESKINYGSKSNWTYKLTMDYPTDEEYEWLSELIVSPQIYAEIEGDYYPVTLTATNHEYSKYQNNKLRVFEVEIELNQTRNGFRR